MEREEKIQRVVIISIVVVAIIIISLLAYILNTTGSDENIGSEETQEQTSDYESASTQIGKSVEESEKEYETAKNISNSTENTNTINATNSTESETANLTTNSTETNSTAGEENVETNSKGQDETETVEEEKEVTFEAPIKGEILREFATDSLVYSDTLKEWITHNGIDIKADKTSVVSAAADGTVYAIKNDPRYGLTVIINHDDGYQTIYSNLLTAEFVVEGEKVTQGQSIGTVGNSAAFEISDDYHLHFELLKDNEYLDPTIYMNFE